MHPYLHVPLRYTYIWPSQDKVSGVVSGCSNLRKPEAHPSSILSILEMSYNKVETDIIPIAQQWLIFTGNLSIRIRRPMQQAHLVTKLKRVFHMTFNRVLQSDKRLISLPYSSYTFQETMIDWAIRCRQSPVTSLDWNTSRTSRLFKIRTFCFEIYVGRACLLGARLSALKRKLCGSPRRCSIFR